MLNMDCKRTSFCYYFSLQLRNLEWLLKIIFILSGCLFIDSELTDEQITCIRTVTPAIKGGKGHRKITIINK